MRTAIFFGLTILAKSTGESFPLPMSIIIMAVVLAMVIMDVADFLKHHAE